MVAEDRAAPLLHLLISVAGLTLLPSLISNCEGAYGCALELYEQGADADQYVGYVLQRVDMLLSFGVVPLLVIDGAPLPAKVKSPGSRWTTVFPFLSPFSISHAALGAGKEQAPSCQGSSTEAHQRAAGSQ